MEEDREKSGEGEGAMIEAGTILFDGLESALLGFAHSCGLPSVAVYSEEKVLEIFEKQGMSRDEAQEYYDFNVLGSSLGERTPLFLTEAGG
jgi:hypothetical protein